MTDALNDQRKKYEDRVKEIQAKMLKVTCFFKDLVT